jgi:hypothetical protein
LLELWQQDVRVERQLLERHGEPAAVVWQAEKAHRTVGQGRRSVDDAGHPTGGVVLKCHVCVGTSLLTRVRGQAVLFELAFQLLR